jgi:hypothetical protein
MLDKHATRVYRTSTDREIRDRLARVESNLDQACAKKARFEIMLELLEAQGARPVQAVKPAQVEVRGKKSREIIVHLCDRP